MKRTILVLLSSTAIALGGDSLEKKLAKRSLPFPRPRADRTLSQALAALSADYQAAYHERLPIYIGLDLAQPPSRKEPQAPPPKIPGLERTPDSSTTTVDPASARLGSGPLRAPVIESLRYLTSLASVTYTIRDDIILIHAKTK